MAAVLRKPILRQMEMAFRNGNLAGVRGYQIPKSLDITDLLCLRKL